MFFDFLELIAVEAAEEFSLSLTKLPLLFLELFSDDEDPDDFAALGLTDVDDADANRCEGCFATVSAVVWMSLLRLVGGLLGVIYILLESWNNS